MDPGSLVLMYAGHSNGPCQRPSAAPKVIGGSANQFPPFDLRVLLNHNCTPWIDHFEFVYPLTPGDISRLPTMIHRTKHAHFDDIMKKGLGPGRWAGESNSVISQCSPTSPCDYARNYGSGRNDDDDHNLVIEYELTNRHAPYKLCSSSSGPI